MAAQSGPTARHVLVGTPPILSLAALECGVETCLAADPLGGVEAIRQKSMALTNLFIALLEQADSHAPRGWPRSHPIPRPCHTTLPDATPGWCPSWVAWAPALRTP